MRGIDDVVVRSDVQVVKEVVVFRAHLGPVAHQAVVIAREFRVHVTPRANLPIFKAAIRQELLRPCFPPRREMVMEDQPAVMVDRVREVRVALVNGMLHELSDTNEPMVTLGECLAHLCLPPLPVPRLIPLALCVE
eukprot:6154615-Prymnesium_polylepis.1